MTYKQDLERTIAEKVEMQTEIDRWIELCKVHDEIGNTLLADVVSLQAEIDEACMIMQKMIPLIDDEYPSYMADLVTNLAKKFIDNHKGE